MKELEEILENSYSYQNGEDVTWEEVKEFMKQAYNKAISDCKDVIYYSSGDINIFELLEKLKK